MAQVAQFGFASLTLYLVAVLCFLIPSAVAVAELGARMPDEGGLYLWIRSAFGDFHGYLAASTVPEGGVGIIEGVAQAFVEIEHGLGLPGVGRAGAALVTLSSLGLLASWMTGTARIPFVIGLHRYLPEALGRVHPRWGSPWVSLVVQGVALSLLYLAAIAGASVREAGGRGIGPAPERGGRRLLPAARAPTPGVNDSPRAGPVSEWRKCSSSKPSPSTTPRRAGR